MKIVILRTVLLMVSMFMTLLCFSEDIRFKDEQVKLLCVANWDNNKDGELSVEEASVVTSLGHVFKENTKITEFTELRFFTGLTSIGSYAFYKCSINKIEFPSSVKLIDVYAFSGSSIGPSLIIPGSVKDIANNAFANCNQLKNVIIEEGVETLGSFAFVAPLSFLSLPSTLVYMNHQVINPYVGSNMSSNTGMSLPEGDFYLYVHSIIPPSIHNNAFYRLFGDGKLVVPFGTKDVYMNSYPWRNFYKYFEYGDVNEDGFVNIADVVAIVNHILGTENGKFNELIADVNGDGSITIADVVLIVSFLLGE